MSLVNPNWEKEVRKTQERLRLRLERVFEETSHDCSVEYFRLGYTDPNNDNGEPSGAGEDWIPVIQDGFVRWRKESLQWITWGFRKLYADTREGQRDDLGSPEDAEKFVWEVINEFFKWNTDENSPLKFKEWEDLVTRKKTPTDPMPEFPTFNADRFVMVTPRCNRLLSEHLADRLSCDFRAQFEQELILLKDELNPASPGMPTTANEGASTGVLATINEKQGQSSSTKPWYWSKELSARDSAISTPARRGLVSLIRGELDFHRERLHSLPTYCQMLKEKYPNLKPDCS